MNLLIHGDFYFQPADTCNWTKIYATGDGPSARFSMAGDCLDPTVSGALAFIGGCNKSLEALDDMYFLYTGLSLYKILILNLDISSFPVLENIGKLSIIVWLRLTIYLFGDTTRPCERIPKG